jgi:hypothetical protein
MMFFRKSITPLPKPFCHIIVLKAHVAKQRISARFTVRETMAARKLANVLASLVDL